MCSIRLTNPSTGNLAGSSTRRETRSSCGSRLKANEGSQPQGPSTITRPPRRNSMIVEVQVTINGSRAATWAAITDIANGAEMISGIENIEVLEKPAKGLV